MVKSLLCITRDSSLSLISPKRIFLISFFSQTQGCSKVDTAVDHPLIPAAIWVDAGGRGEEGGDPGGGGPSTAAANSHRQEREEGRK